MDHSMRLSGAAEALRRAVGVSGRLLWLWVVLGIEVSVVNNSHFHIYSFQVFSDVRLQLLTRRATARELKLARFKDLIFPLLPKRTYGL